MTQDLIWEQIQLELPSIDQGDLLTQHILKPVLSSGNLWEAISNVLLYRLGTSEYHRTLLTESIKIVVQNDRAIQKSIQADLQAYFNRDFASKQYLNILLFSRGFHGLVAYRVSRKYYLDGQEVLAFYLRELIFERFGLDIHPNARIGKGIVIDHGTGIVIGETSIIGDGAFILHNVTLGSTGKESGDRHPKLESDIFIGAGATILGNITIHKGANIAAGSIVLKPVPANTTVAGVPAKVVGTARKLQ